jgi:hypothetical protein
MQRQTLGTTLQDWGGWARSNVAATGADDSSTPALGSIACHHPVTPLLLLTCTPSMNPCAMYEIVTAADAVPQAAPMLLPTTHQ